MKLIQPELQTGGKRYNYLALLGPWVLLAVLVGGISALFSVVTTRGAGVSSGYEEDALFYCDSNGKIRYKYSDRDYGAQSPYWDSSLFLSVTMGFHGLSFVQAKAIDIGFDLVVGRGSQIVAALATYPIFRRAVLRSMEVREVSIALLLPFFLERLSFNTLWSMVTNMRSPGQKGLGHRPRSSNIKAKSKIDWRLTLILLTGSYILALPTLMSAMTSYQARSAPFLPSKNNTEYLSTTNLTTPDLAPGSPYKPNTIFAQGDLTFPGSDIDKHGKCLPAAEYIWGFSSLMLFTFSMLSILVTFCLMALHYDAFLHSSADRYKLHCSPYRDVLDLAALVSAHYGHAEAAGMSAKALDRAMGEDPAGTGLETEMLHASRMARWRRQRAGSAKRKSTWDRARKRARGGDERPVDMEESLMAIGVDAQGPDVEMGKVPAAKVVGD